ncbi:hypothetical protein [Acinetobacter radioresistens]|uniref:hypothetical protein n=1 Tax=Acinetobacter radioresistens TaxID=40216 RepID=UPI002005505F|nr:hypothetical protein [Acinetobacter radioresistens]MCK4108916.1 hypothetical protein [Acinetobacter radioresistens]
MDNLFGFYPGQILSYNKVTKKVQVSVEPYTTGSENGIEAKLAYPIGDDDLDTEIAINGQPDIWVFFENGQFKKPVACFFRTRQMGSVTDVRRIRQKRIELIADEVLIDAKVHITKDTNSDAGFTSTGDMVAGNVSLIKHPHGGVQNGSGQTNSPVSQSGSNSGNSDGSSTNSGGNNGAGSDSGNNENSSGDSGNNGEIGENPNSGTVIKGDPGPPGKNGITAFQSAVAEGWTGTHAEWLESLKAKVTLYSKGGPQSSGQMKIWRGVIDSSAEWFCDYSSAGFTTRPIIIATPVQTKPGETFKVFVDTLSATNTRCYGQSDVGGQIDILVMGI